jgi:hypothetical protein
MGDLSTEPSMEEILSSIKRIIAEEGEVAPGRQRRPLRPTAPSPHRPAEDEVLELRDPVPEPARPAAPPPRTPEPEPVAAAPAPSPAAPPSPPEPIVSRETAAATRDALGQLSRLLVKPEPGSDGTLEGLVRDMLRPMLRDWLDAHLPALVEEIVSREIAKITAGR